MPLMTNAEPFGKQYFNRLTEQRISRLKDLDTDLQR